MDEEVVKEWIRKIHAHHCENLAVSPRRNGENPHHLAPLDWFMEASEFAIADLTKFGLAFGFDTRNLDLIKLYTFILPRVRDLSLVNGIEDIDRSIHYWYRALLLFINTAYDHKYCFIQMRKTTLDGTCKSLARTVTSETPASFAAYTYVKGVEDVAKAIRVA